VTLVIADDHPAFVDGVVHGLERRGVRVLARCHDGEAALAAILRHRPAVALLDLRMPGLGGREVLVEVVRRKLATRVIVCSEQQAPAVVRALLGDGACGYLSKTTSCAAIADAVRAVAGGEVCVSAELQDGLNGQLAGPPRTLSPREREVLTLAAEGLTDQQIAARMYISRETVRTNLKRCSDKLGVSGRAALVATALRQGQLE